jgi:hypothetical protein
LVGCYESFEGCWQIESCEYYDQDSCEDVYGSCTEVAGYCWVPTCEYSEEEPCLEKYAACNEIYSGCWNVYCGEGYVYANDACQKIDTCEAHMLVECPLDAGPSCTVEMSVYNKKGEMIRCACSNDGYYTSSEMCEQKNPSAICGANKHNTCFVVTGCAEGYELKDGACVFDLCGNDYCPHFGFCPTN